VWKEAMMAVRSILCPVDFSDQSRQALRWAAAIAQSRGAQLTVMTVVEPLLAQAAAIRLGVDLTDAANADTTPALREVVETAVPEDVRQATHVRLEVAIGDAAEGILRTARERQAEVIVMGTHGRGGLRKLILGSTAEQVLRRAEAAVLVVPTGAVRAPEYAPHPNEQPHHGRIEPTPTAGG
jgi:universal stress protein A